MTPYMKQRQSWLTTGKPPKEKKTYPLKRTPIKKNRSPATKERLIPLPTLLELAQKVFNTWIRNRDKNLPCISGGGKSEQAGHYYPAGSYSGIRFDEMNVNGQSVQDNCFKSGNEKQYRVNLVARYGTAAMYMLDERARLTRLKKWSREELDLVIKKYKIN